MRKNLPTEWRGDGPGGQRSRSRAKLRAAAADLLDERDPAGITVTDLVRAAGVSRPTFYATYADLPDAWADAALLRLEEAFEGIDPTDPRFVAGDPEALLETIGKTIGRLLPHLEFMRRVLDAARGHEVLRRAIDFLAGRILAAPRLGAAIAEGPLDDAVGARAMAAAIVWTAVEWAYDDDRGPVEELVADLGTLLFRGAIGIRAAADAGDRAGAVGLGTAADPAAPAPAVPAPSPGGEESAR